MKKINFSDDYHKIKSLVDESKSAGHEICLWQKDEETQKRHIYNMKVEKNFLQEKLIWMKSHVSRALSLKQGVVFYYCHELKIIFKSNIYSIEDEMVSIIYPEEATLLEENDQITEQFEWMKGAEIEDQFAWNKSKKDYIMTEVIRVSGGKGEPIDDIIKVKGHAPLSEQEEIQFIALRESARVAPKDNKFVTLVKDDAVIDETVYKLFDLSQGGAGLLIFSPTEFYIGEKVSIIAIDSKPIDKVLKGTVVAIRPYDIGKSEYKLGIKFS